MVAHDPIKGMVTNPRPRLLHPNDWISRLHCCVIPEGSLGTSSLNRDLGTFFLFFFLILSNFTTILLTMMKYNWSVFMRRLKTPLRDYKPIALVALLIYCLRIMHCFVDELPLHGNK